MKLGSAIPWALLLSTATLVSGAWNRRSRSCGGVLRDPPGKIFNSDGPQKDCVWTIKVKPHFHVVLAIPPLNLSCGKEYVELLDGPPGSEIIGKICGGISLVFRSSSNIATIKYLRTSGQRASPFHIYYYADPEGKWPGIGTRSWALPCSCLAVWGMGMRLCP
uniref:CUB domain-containing protein n=1 Tax=Sus scrofa TaxID=9823 RepID=A0A8D1MB44_PIG